MNHGISKSKPTRRGCRAEQRKLKSKGKTNPTSPDSQPCIIINENEIYEIHDEQNLHNILPGTLNIQNVTPANAASWDFPQHSRNVNNLICIETDPQQLNQIPLNNKNQQNRTTKQQSNKSQNLSGLPSIGIKCSVSLSKIG